LCILVKITEVSRVPESFPKDFVDSRKSWFAHGEHKSVSRIEVSYPVPLVVVIILEEELTTYHMRKRMLVSKRAPKP